MGAVASCVTRILPSAFSTPSDIDQTGNIRRPNTSTIIEEGENVSNRINNGSYFGTHFLMGGERFEIAKPDSFLFGDISDLELIGTKAVDYPYHVRGLSHQFKVLNTLINVRRNSVRFVKIDDEKTLCYRLEFIFDADTDCYVQIHFFAREFVEGDNIHFSSKHVQETPDKTYFSMGADQTFDQFLFYPEKYDFPFHYEGGSSFPIVIEVRSIANVTRRIPVQVQATYCSIERSNDHTGLLLLKPVKQKLIADGVTYLMQEIYGIENKEVNVKSIDDNGGECIICLGNPRDTVILPCRHLCICNSCAETLKYKVHNCPICRSPFKALFRFIPADADGLPNQPSRITLVEALNGETHEKSEESEFTDTKEMIFEAMSSQKNKNRKGKAAKVLNKSAQHTDINSVEIEMEPINSQINSLYQKNNSETKDNEREVFLPDNSLHATVVRIDSATISRPSSQEKIEAKPYSHSSP